MADSESFTHDEYIDGRDKAEEACEKAIQEFEESAKARLKSMLNQLRQERLGAISKEIDQIIKGQDSVNDDEALELSELSSNIDDILFDHKQDNPTPSPETEALYGEAETEKDRIKVLVNQPEKREQEETDPGSPTKAARCCSLTLDYI